MARPFELLRTRDQWLRASHDGTAIDEATGGVQLGWSDPPRRDGGAAAPPGGLAFDAECRLYRSVPAEGRIERILTGGDAAPEPLDVLTGERALAGGDFAAAHRNRAPLREPRGLAVDDDDRLYIAETGARRVLVLDLWSRRLLRTVRFGGAPLDVACRGRDVWTLLARPGGLARITARTGPHRVEPLPLRPPVPPDAEPLRVAVAPAAGAPVVLLGAGGDRWIVPTDRPHLAFVVAAASDLEFDGDGTLVVARGAADDLLRFRLDAEGVFEDRPLRARGYDGSGLVRGRDGKVGFRTPNGFRAGVPARIDYVPRGRVYTYRLDAGAFQTEWGRVFVDACVPEGAQLRVHAATADDPGDEETILRAPPLNATNALVSRPDLSPPLVPASLAPAGDDAWRPLHRRETGRELPWARPARGDPFVTYEAPVAAPAGRYLWLAFELRGTLHATPRIAGVRAEHPSHDLLRRLPKTFSREEETADFLRRYLAVFDGALSDLDDKAAERRALVDAASAPAEILPWLAGFVGLVLDEEWDEPTRRRLIAAATELFRFRGTVHGLKSFLELVLGVKVIVLERYRFRGIGGALLGDEDAALAGAVVGTTLRVGGEVGRSEARPLEGGLADLYASHAHRFTVVVRGELTAVQRRIVDHVLRIHRPAHTLVDVCTIGNGMRVGRGIHVGLLSSIGRTGGFATAHVGDTAVGRGTILGRPAAGAKLGETRLDTDARIG